MRITEAAQRLETSPRMLRYRDSLGLLPAVREHRPSRRPPRRQASPPHPGQAPSIPPPTSPSPSTGQPSQAPSAPAALHRRFDQQDLDAVALALAIERRYDITPAALAFGLRVLAEPAVRADVAELGRRIGRIPRAAPAARALDFEQERALRLLSMSPRL